MPTHDVLDTDVIASRGGQVNVVTVAFGPPGPPGPPGDLTVQDEGLSLPAQPLLNFVGAGVVATEDIGNGAIVVTISGGAGAGYETIQNNGSPVTQRVLLNFGTGVGATDDAGNLRTDVSIVPGEIDHDGLLNYSVDQHRTINDAGVATTDLWSANKINAELTGKSDTGHPHSLAFYTTHTWTVPGAFNAAMFLVPFFVGKTGTQVVEVVRAKHQISGGTSATVTLQRNGVALTGVWAGISVTTTATETDGDDEALADGDKLSLEVNAVSGSPINMTFSVILRHTVVPS